MVGLFCFTFWILIASAQSVSTKMDFDETESTSIVTNSSKVSDEDVEVQHTIVVSTKLKNNNRRGLHSASDGNAGTLSYNIGRPGIKEDSSEVPIVYGMKSVDTTEIRSPDTRYKSKIYPDAVFINRNIRDEYDHYPNAATNPMLWKPSNFFNNINWWNPENGNQVPHGRADIPIPDNQRTVKFHRKITDDGMKEFYCKKCRELSPSRPGQGGTGCGQQRRNSWVYETTTPKMKLDGKLAKLN